MDEFDEQAAGHVTLRRLIRGSTAWVGTSAWSPVRNFVAALMVMAFLSMAVSPSAGSSGVPDGIWLVDPNSAVQLFDCEGLLCGRVAWLRNVQDRAGQIQRDKYNPDPALRPRLVCGLTILWGLRPEGTSRWRDGWLYNPDDGGTYNVSAELRSSEVIEARIYKVLPIFGTTKTLLKIPRHGSEGWC